jgi:hypothetical protein
LGRRSDAAVAFVKATGTASASGDHKCANEAACVRRTANDRRANSTAVDRTGFRGRTHTKETEIR